MAKDTEPTAAAQPATEDSAPEPEEETVDVFAGDDPKAKFREALARKHGGGGKGAAADGPASKVGGSAHGPAKAQRTFRRKSGG